MADATRYVLSVMCEDRVGLVSRLARAVERLHGNIEELHQGVVQGYFVLNFMATFPEAATAEAVTRSLEAAGEGPSVLREQRDERDHAQRAEQREGKRRGEQAALSVFGRVCRRCLHKGFPTPTCPMVPCSLALSELFKEEGTHDEQTVVGSGISALLRVRRVGRGDNKPANRWRLAVRVSC
ncbi:MAG: ACT domain-containing protein [Planctomycetota bacterium]